MRFSVLGVLLTLGLSSPGQAQNYDLFYTVEYASCPGACPTLRVFDSKTGVMHSSVPTALGDPPTDLATAPDGRVYLSTSSSLYEIDPQSGADQFLGTFPKSGVVGLEFACDGGLVWVTQTGHFGIVDLATGQFVFSTKLSGIKFSGDVATRGNSEFYASYNSGSGSRLARIDYDGVTATWTDLVEISPNRRIWGLDFDASGDLIASDNASPCQFYAITGLPGTPVVSPIATTGSTSLSGSIAGIASIIPSGQQIEYCSATFSSCGTTPDLVASGVPSATASSGFALTASGLRGGAPVALWYTVSGRAAVPFGNVTLCLAGPRRAVPVCFASGMRGQCDGQVVIDFNAYARGLLGGNPASFLSQPGTVVQCQFIGRDNPYLLATEALEFSICN
jgi:hypothetical protein